MLLIVAVIILCQCQPATKSEGSEEDLNALIGEWRNTTLRVELDKKHGEPSDVFEVDEATWEETLKIRPIRTFFNEDGSFNSEHYNLQDSLVLNPEGTWSATEDEIVMITVRPFNDTTSCSYSVVDGIATFGCWVDWDEDGEKDDWYLGAQRKY